MGTILKYNCGRDFISTDDIKYTTNTNLTSFLKDIQNGPEAIEIKRKVTKRKLLQLYTTVYSIDHTVNGIIIDNPYSGINDSTICNDLYHSLIGDIVPIGDINVTGSNSLCLYISDMQYPCMVGGTYTDNAIKITTKITEDTLLFTNHPILGKTYLKWIPVGPMSNFEVVSQERYLTIPWELYIKSILRRLYNKYHTLLMEASIEDLSQMYGIIVKDEEKGRGITEVDLDKFDSFDYIDLSILAGGLENVSKILLSILDIQTLSDFFMLVPVSTKLKAFNNCTIRTEFHTSPINIEKDPFLPKRTLTSSHGIIADTTGPIEFREWFTPGILPENHTNTGIFEYNIHNNIISGVTYELEK